MSKETLKKLDALRLIVEAGGVSVPHLNQAEAKHMLLRTLDAIIADVRKVPSCRK